ncbi:hypothetical protein [Kitasatospora sp. NBC_01266]|jgi:hypothetical protein|uniref:hypothetical protein n=1 Tax=Kitasatospora sp. NBC_01266 TaxID=2903572 RepID=UPI002E339497|nr:hypothetical protein [Kitasatospora sp. NBC_01266]
MRKILPLLAAGLLAACGFLLPPVHASADTGTGTQPPTVPVATASPAGNTNGCC